jgi:hypothetical protein
MTFSFMRIAGVALLLFVMSGASAVFAADSVVTRQTMKGLPGVYVLVAETHPHKIQKYAQKAGLMKEQLLKDVERKLKENGIKTLSRDEQLETWGNPVLYVHLNIQEKERYVYTYDIKAEIQQIVQMEANPAVKAPLPTWSITTPGLANIGNLNGINNDVMSLVGQFAKTFILVNNGKNR